MEWGEGGKGGVITCQLERLFSIGMNAIILNFAPHSVKDPLGNFSHLIPFIFLKASLSREWAALSYIVQSEWVPL